MQLKRAKDAGIDLFWAVGRAVLHRVPVVGEVAEVAEDFRRLQAERQMRHAVQEAVQEQCGVERPGSTGRLNETNSTARRLGMSPEQAAEALQSVTPEDAARIIDELLGAMPAHPTPAAIAPLRAALVSLPADFARALDRDCARLFQPGQVTPDGKYSSTASSARAASARCGPPAANMPTSVTASSTPGPRPLP